MTDYITTFTGLHFYPTRPEESAFRIEDIAHALSLLCRGNGQVKTFLSVGKHCIWCAREAAGRGYSVRVQLACLLHDACESYLSAVPTPFKRQLPGYEALEDRMLALVYEHFLGSPLTEREAAQVKEIDRDLLWFDLTCLLGEPQSEPEPVMTTVRSYEVLPFAEVERQYLALYHELRSQLDAGAV